MAELDEKPKKKIDFSYLVNPKDRVEKIKKLSASDYLGDPKTVIEQIKSGTYGSDSKQNTDVPIPVPGTLKGEQAKVTMARLVDQRQEANTLGISENTPDTYITGELQNEIVPLSDNKMVKRTDLAKLIDAGNNIGVKITEDNLRSLDGQKFGELARFVDDVTGKKRQAVNIAQENYTKNVEEQQQQAQDKNQFNKRVGELESRADVINNYVLSDQEKTKISRLQGSDNPNDVDELNRMYADIEKRSKFLDNKNLYTNTLGLASNFDPVNYLSKVDKDLRNENLSKQNEGEQLRDAEFTDYVKSVGKGLLSIPKGFIQTGLILSDKRLPYALVSNAYNFVTGENKDFSPKDANFMKQVRDDEAMNKMVMDGINKFETAITGANDFKQNWGTQFSSGLGSFAGFMLSGSVATRILGELGLSAKAIETLSPGLTGALSQAGSSAYDIYEKTGDYNKAVTSFLMGIPIGFTESIGLGRYAGTMNPIKTLSKDGFKKVIGESFKEMFEEGGQESLQQYLQQSANNYLDPEHKENPIFQLKDAFTTAGVLGAIVPFTFKGLGGLGKIAGKQYAKKYENKVSMLTDAYNLLQFHKNEIKKNYSLLPEETRDDTIQQIETLQTNIRDGFKEMEIPIMEDTNGAIKSDIQEVGKMSDVNRLLKEHRQNSAKWYDNKPTDNVEPFQEPQQTDVLTPSEKLDAIKYVDDVKKSKKETEQQTTPQETQTEPVEPVQTDNTVHTVDTYNKRIQEISKRLKDAGLEAESKTVGDRTIEELPKDPAKTLSLIETGANRIINKKGKPVTETKTEPVAKQEPTSTPVAKTDDFYISNIDDKGKHIFVKVSGKPVTIKYSGDFFISKPNGKGNKVFTIRETQTGKLVGEGKTEKLAIADAEAIIEMYGGQEKIDGKVQDLISKYGISPRYQESKPESKAQEKAKTETPVLPKPSELPPIDDKTLPKNDKTEVVKTEEKKSSTQVNIPQESAKPFIEMANSIPEDELYTEPEKSYGREDEPHVTVLYGLKTENSKEVEDLVKNYGDVKIKLGKTSLFENDKYDVLKVDVESKDLSKLNKILRDNTDYENDYPDYQPHITIAYLKKGEGKKYVGQTIKGLESITLDKLIFSDKERNHTEIDLKQKEKPSKEKKAKPVSKKEKSSEDITTKDVFDTIGFTEKDGQYSYTGNNGTMNVEIRKGEKKNSPPKYVITIRGLDGALLKSVIKGDMVGVVDEFHYEIKQRLEKTETSKPENQLPNVYARNKAVGLLTGGLVERVEQSGYEFIHGELENGSNLYYDLVGMITGSKADRLIGSGVTIKKKSSRTAEKPVSKTKKKLLDIDSSIDDVAKAFHKSITNKLSAGLDPEQLALGLKLVGLYTQKGFYKFKEIAEDIYGRYGKEFFEDIYSSLKTSYANSFMGDTREAQKQYTNIYDVNDLELETLLNEFEGENIYTDNDKEKTVNSNNENNSNENTTGSNENSGDNNSELDRAGLDGQNGTDNTDKERGVSNDDNGRQSDDSGKSKSGKSSKGKVRDSQSNSKRGNSTDELQSKPKRVAGQQTTGSNEDNVSATGDDDMVESSDVGNNYDVRENYNLQSKDPVLLTKGERKKINAQVKKILASGKTSSELTDDEKEMLRQYTGEGGLTSGTKEALTQFYTPYPLIKAIYSALKQSGFDGSKILEPSAGNGNFIGMQPYTNWTAIDLDKTNYEVAKLLYPGATHYNTSYENYKDTGFDLVISNIPFLEVRGARGMQIRPDIKTLHDFYFVHSLDRVKPNGIIAFVTTKGVMDKVDSKVRKEIISKADLLGAYRLPSGTFEKNTQTSVVTDVVFLQRRPDGTEPKSDQKKINDLFLSSTKTADGIHLNDYYKANPKNILGEMTVGKSQYNGRPVYDLKGELSYSELQQKITLPKYIKYGQQAPANADENTKAEMSGVPSKYSDFQDWAETNNTVYRKLNKYSDAENITRYKENIYFHNDDWYVKDFEHEFNDVDTQVKIYKKLDDETINSKLMTLKSLQDWADNVQSGRQSPEMVADVVQQTITNYNSLYKVHPLKDKALKSFFKKLGEDSLYKELSSFITEDWKPKAVFSKQTKFENSGTIKITAKSSLNDRALFNESFQGIIDFKNSLTHLDRKEFMELLKNGYAYVDENTLQNEILYYSGNIYRKLSELESEIENNSEDLELTGILQNQLDKLEEVKPTPKSLDEIDIKGNEKWFEPIFKRLARVNIFLNKETNTREYDTEFGKIYDNYLNNKQLVKLTYTDTDGKEFPLPESTQKKLIKDANEEIKRVKSEIKKRVNEDAEIKAQILNTYNSRYRAYVKPDYTKAQYIIADVLAEIPSQINGKPFSLRPNQINWIIKALYEGKGINAHDVGGGKTFAGIVLARALKKKGIANKPLFNVPAKTIHKWKRDILALYPNAKIYDLGSLSKEKRTEQLFDIANNEADYVLISHEGFGHLRLSLDKEMEYFEKMSNQSLEADETGMTEREKSKQNEKIQKYMQAIRNVERDDRLTFDKLGFDAVITDEAHNYKNIGINGELVKYGAGIPFTINPGKRTYKINRKKEKVLVKETDPTLASARSYDFRFKMKFIAEKNNGNNVYLLTATPTPNKPMETLTMLRHLNERVLDEYGIETDSDFANMFLEFGSVSTPGTKKGFSNIVSAVKNAIALRDILDRFVDKLSMEQMSWIKLPTAKVINHYLQQSDGGKEIFDDLRRRMKTAKGFQKSGEKVDTTVQVYTSGRTASIDPRLYDSQYRKVTVYERTGETENDKLQNLIDTAKKNLKENPEGGQIIFSDLAGHTQAEKGILEQNLHSEIKAELVKSGVVTAQQVAIISGQEITNPDTGKERKLSGDKLNEAKQLLVDLYNEGQIKVIIGTTQSAGEGMDIQVKTTDIHHLDIPYTPKDFTQRNGRGVRYGNENDNVNIHYYFTAGSFDQLSYGIIAKKKGWNEAVWDKDVADTIDTVSEMLGGFPSEKEIAIELESDPIKKELLILDFERDRLVKDLEYSVDEYNRNKQNLQYEIEFAPKNKARLEKSLAEREKINNQLKLEGLEESTVERLKKYRDEINKDIARYRAIEKDHPSVIEKIQKNIEESKQILDETQGKVDAFVSVHIHPDDNDIYGEVINASKWTAPELRQQLPTNALGNPVNEAYLRVITTKLKQSFPGYTNDDIRFMRENQFVSRLADIEGKYYQNSDSVPLGYVGTDGKVYFNVDKAGTDTPIHELSHIYWHWAEKSAPAVWQRAVQLVNENPEVLQETANLYDYDLENAYQYRQAIHEVLATGTGIAGAINVEKSIPAERSELNQKIRNLFDAVIRKIKKFFGIADKTEYSKLNADSSLADFFNAISSDLLKGKTIADIKPNEVNKVALYSYESKKTGKQTNAVNNSNPRFQVSAPTGQAMQDIIDELKQKAVRPVSKNNIAEPEKKWITKKWDEWFTSAGTLGEDVFKLANKMNFAINSQLKAVEYTVKDLRKAVIKDYGKTPDLNIIQAIDGYIKGDTSFAQYLTPDVLKLSDKMRDNIDLMSIELAKSGAVKEDMAKKILKNINSYTHRSYRVHDEPKEYRKKFIDIDKKILSGKPLTEEEQALKDVELRARDYIEISYMLMGRELSDTELDKKISDILQHDKAQFLNQGQLGKKNLGILKHREDVPPEIRDLLGEYKDPLVNYTKSIAKMVNLIEKHKFLTELRDSGIDKFVFSAPPNKSYVRIAETEDKLLFPLNGYFVHQDLKEAIETHFAPEQVPDWLRYYYKFNGFVKYSKTALAWVTTMRNIISNIPMMSANGYWQLKHGKDPVMNTLGRIFGDKTLAREKYIDYIKYGVVEDSAIAGEMRAIIKDAGMHDTADRLIMSRIEKIGMAVKKGIEAPGVVYTGIDDFFKIYAFENEVQRYSKAYPNKSEEEIKSIAGEIIRNVLPTYSMIGKLGKTSRRFPLFGTFVSFPAEIIRNSYNIVEQGLKEIGQAETRKIGYSRLASAMATVSSTAVASYISALVFGYNDDDEKKSRQFLADWNKNSQLIYTGKKENGQIRFIDISFTDPYSYIKKGITALWSGDNLIDRGVGSLVEFTAPFLGEEILAGKIMDVLRNKSAQSGKTIYNEDAPTGDKLKDISLHFWDAFEPGTLSQIRRIVYGAMNRVAPSGRVYDLEDELIALSGFRVTKVDVAQSMSYRIYDMMKELQNIKRIYNEVETQKGDVTKEQKQKAFDKANGLYQEWQDRLRNLVLDGKILGVDERDITLLLKDTGLSKKIQESIKSGTKLQLDPKEYSLKELAVMQTHYQERIDTLKTKQSTPDIEREIQRLEFQVKGIDEKKQEQVKKISYDRAESTLKTGLTNAITNQDEEDFNNNIIYLKELLKDSRTPEETKEDLQIFWEEGYKDYLTDKIEDIRFKIDEKEIDQQKGNAMIDFIKKMYSENRYRKNAK